MLEEKFSMPKNQIQLMNYPYSKFEKYNATLRGEVRATKLLVWAMSLIPFTRLPVVASHCVLSRGPYTYVLRVNTSPAYAFSN